MKRRLLTVVGATLAILMLTSTAALAHFCFNASRPGHASQNAARSEGWWSFEELVRHEIAPTLCNDGVEYLVGAIDPEGEFATHAKVVVASGQLNNNPQLSGDDKGIDHIFPGHPELVEAVGAALPAAFARCGP